jgi:hypothetical protein
MRWSDISFDPARKTLRQFAAGWLVGFLALGAGQYFLKGRLQAGLALATLAVVVGVPALIWPRLLRWIFVGWMVLAFPVGWLVSTMMLLVLYYVVLTPVAVLFRLRGRDLLARRPAPGQDSYWAPKQTVLDVRRFFRQY